MKMLRTFIIEDSPVIRQNLISTLEDLAPVQVVGFAESQSEAIEALSGQSTQADLVIVDVVLKEGTGLGVLRHAAVHTEGRTFVILSNYATKEIRDTGKALGAARVFDKSQELDALLEYCETLAAA